MKMKKLGLLFMMLCMVFAVNAQELKKGDKLPDFHKGGETMRVKVRSV